ncbi:hypothetical protein J2732_000002 [Achromobacter deleyi]|uniref:hypothetical protein n=1 Tax=Achromobacter deleyi TaxID=1353891 RepID=UPI00285946F7|nr:hypothetical protein [Achromobacter deleyi]MDR6599019.1 hypothetical protein [Achromobacter deleyi]
MDQVVFVKTTQASVARSLGVSDKITITAASNAPRVVLQAPLVTAVPEALLSARRRLDARAA